MPRRNLCRRCRLPPLLRRLGAELAECLPGNQMTLDVEGVVDDGCAERLIGTLRRECLDQVVIFSEMHLRRILSAYAAYYNQARTHLALQKDAPLHRAVQRSGAISAIPILAGLHHQYVRI